MRPHKQVAGRRSLGAEVGGKPRAPVRSGIAAHREPGQQVILEDSLFDQRERLGRDAFLIHAVVAQQRVAVPLGLGGVVDHVQPFGKDARALPPLQVARGKSARASGLGHGLAGERQVSADQFAHDLGAGDAFKQNRTAIGFPNRRLGQRGHVFRQTLDLARHFALFRHAVEVQRQKGHRIAHSHAVRARPTARARS